jgi:hypothetical protein
VTTPKSSNPRKNATTTRGKPFAPGNPGRPKGARHRTTMAAEAMLDGEAKKLTRKAIDLALNGDTVALRLCLERLVPPRKEARITISLPPVATAADTVAASSAVLAAVAAGDCTPDEGVRVMALLSAHRSMLDFDDLERRIAALEN